jgi:hypothetical protein
VPKTFPPSSGLISKLQVNVRPFYPLLFHFRKSVYKKWAIEFLKGRKVTGYENERWIEPAQDHAQRWLLILAMLVLLPETVNK